MATTYNKEKQLEANKKYRINHPEKWKEIQISWRTRNEERDKEIRKKALDKFQDKVNWSSYCNNSRKKRVERLRSEGVINVWGVIQKGEEPRYSKKGKE